MSNYKRGGWDQKYVIQKRCARCRGKGLIGLRSIVPRHCRRCEGTGVTQIDPKAIYFVLRIDKDPHARKAVLAYAASVEQDNPKFAQDIRDKVKAVVHAAVGSSPAYQPT